jgi:hypothetical protein
MGLKGVLLSIVISGPIAGFFLRNLLCFIRCACVYNVCPLGKVSGAPGALGSVGEVYDRRILAKTDDVYLVVSR